MALPGTATGYAAPSAPPGANQQPPAKPKPPTDPSTTDPAKRDELLGKGWQQSGDRLWTAIGDGTGFHLLVAEAKTGYTWRTAATLVEPGLDADEWIGNACVTASGKRAVVAYAPRTFTNDAKLFQRGAFTAVVDLDSDKVTRLPVKTSLAYYNPGCGAGESAALTQGGSDDLGKTRLLPLDAASGSVGKATELAGQVTSAVPVRDGFVAAGAGSLLRIGVDGKRTVLSKTNRVPYELHVDAQGGVVFLDNDGKTARVRRAADVTTVKDAATLATGASGSVSVAASADGKVFITGRADHLAALPATVRALNVPSDAKVSTTGDAVVSDVQAAGPQQQPQAAQPVHIQTRNVRTGKDIGFTVDPAATLTPRSSPVDDGRYCAVPRNDPNTQVYQPTMRQVEWAADMAIFGDLQITRPQNWRSNGLPQYVPQQLFPLTPLKNAPAGAHVPAQVILGVMGQESNLWEAARNVLPGETGNPLIGNYYGLQIYDGDPSNDWDIHWDKADCGYGLSQVTDGMRLPAHPKDGEAELPWIQQQAIATDYAANVAAGLNILISKWNQLQDLGLTVNNNDPTKLENWFMALWAYNSGYHLPGEADSHGAYGLGWANNPANSDYATDRHPFGTSPADFAHPQNWPYEEKVLGFAANPPSGFAGPGDEKPFFNAAWWNGTDDNPDGTPGTATLNKLAVKPPVNLFCTADDNCNPGTSNPNGAGPCAHQDPATGEYDSHCWWHYPVTWKDDCSYSCGNEAVRFDYPAYAAEASGNNSYPPDCGMAGAPAGTLIVDDIADSVPSVRDPNCARQNQGSFDFAFGADANGLQASKIDLHQLGSGYGGHFWYDDTYGQDALGSKMSVTGTWTLNRALTGWTRILVHLPDHMAESQQADYQIDLGSGTPTAHRSISQERGANQWVSLGVYQVNGVPRVSLSNITPHEGYGADYIAWDAVAFQPLPGKPANIVAVLGDSYTSGEGVGDYYHETDLNHGNPAWNACRRSVNGYGRQLVPPGNTQSLGQVEDAFGTQSEVGIVACSGANTGEVDGTSVPSSWGDPANYQNGDGEFREMAQVKSGVLDGDTTLVVLTIGANDGNAFASAVSDCLSAGCGSSDFYTKYEGLADAAQNNIARVIKAIAGAASHAQIMLVGYPDIFETDGLACGSSTMSAGNAKALSTVTQYLDQKQQATVNSLAAQNIRVAYSNPIPAFTNHGICAGSDSWFNDETWGPLGDGDFHSGDKSSPFCFWKVLGGACFSRVSFHPTTAGASAYATFIAQRLSEIGYHGS
jgi:lysophospholipase L1-like esterase